jgi:hypothetical protein
VRALKPKTAVRLVLLFSVLALSLCVLAIPGLGNEKPLKVPDGMSALAGLPGADPTTPPNIPTPTTGTVDVTPTPAILQSPGQLTVVTSTLDTQPNLIGLGTPYKNTIPIHALMWAPTGDKILYLDNAGNLDYANPDGSGATVLYTYNPSYAFNALQDQQPTGNTILIPDLVATPGSPESPNPQGLQYHIAVVSFTTGQPPTFTRMPAPGPVQQIHWWSADRASGVMPGTYVGGDMLVTFDAAGNVVSQTNIPYMETGAVQPGGQWLAYATSQQNTETVLQGSDPQTVYLLNLSTRQRIQVTPVGMGVAVRNWSPNGKWFVMDAVVNGALQGVLVSADGKQQINLAPSFGHGIYNGAWSADSQSMAFSVQLGGQEDPNSPSYDYTNQVYVVTVPGSGAGSIVHLPSSAVMQPSWSPSGALTVLSFDSACAPWPCSATSPAFYH